MRAQPSQSLWRQLAWFVGLWLAGVGAVGLVGLVIRAWLR
jgi:hypothetical protein